MAVQAVHRGNADFGSPSKLVPKISVGVVISWYDPITTEAPRAMVITTMRTFQLVGTPTRVEDWELEAAADNY